MSLFAQQVASYNILQAALLATGRAGLALAVAEHDRAVVMGCVMVLVGPSCSSSLCTLNQPIRLVL